jgi:DNA-binding NarL/FixJ family response regulator
MVDAIMPMSFYRDPVRKQLESSSRPIDKELLEQWQEAVWKAYNNGKTREEVATETKAREVAKRSLNPIYEARPW